MGVRLQMVLVHELLTPAGLRCLEFERHRTGHNLSTFSLRLEVNHILLRG
jgi:hypothetical protein